MPRRVRFCLVLVVLSLGGAWLWAARPATSPGPRPATSPAPRPAAAPAAPAKPASSGVAVLDTLSSWRMHNTLQPPVIQMDDQLKPVRAGYYIDHETAPPPADWMKADFDDSSWVREPASRFSKTQTLSRLCLRGRFRVSDPAKVNDLRLTVEYRGGAIVYLNGREIQRGQVAPGASLAEPYPQEAFVGADGRLLGEEARDEEGRRRLALRNRALRDVPIPKDRLVPGLNVLAIEVLRAPYDKAMEEKKVTEGRSTRYDLNWNTCEIARIDLRASSEAGLVPNVSRPKGLQVWNSPLLAGDFDIDFGDPTEPLRPIAISGARNGWFSGKVVLGCDQPLRGLKATAGDLKGPAGTIPAAEVRVRYGIPWGSELLTIHHVRHPNPYPRSLTLMGAIADQPLEEYPLARPPTRTLSGRPYDPGNERFGAVVPVWVTVHIPASAAAGEYAGQLTLQADGEKPTTAAVRLKVIDWALPDPQDYRTWVEMIQSPDTLSVEYGEPLWSPKHWRLIAESMKYLRDVGSRALYVPLIAQNNLGNAESMVRWVRKGPDQYGYDFSILDKYLDVAQQNMGKPKLVVFEVWDVYMIPVGGRDPDVKEGGQPQATLDYRRQMKLPDGTGPIVTLLDPATGKTENLSLPGYADPGSKALWGPLLSEVRKRMQQRGLEGVMALGTVSDFPPAKGEFALFQDISPQTPWVVHSHHGGNNFYGLAKAVYQTRVWNNDFPTGDPNRGRQHGWQGNALIANYQRERTVMEFTCSAWHNMAEMNIAGQQRGVGRLGADFWQAVRDKNGQRKGTVAARYPQSSRRNLDLYTSMLAPGAEGPVATTRLEAFRQGVEECEARVFIDQALVDKGLRAKLGEPLAQRCQDALDERNWCTIKGMAHLQLCGPGWLYAGWYDMEGPAGHLWFLGSGWERRAEELFALAGQVRQKIAAK